LFEGKLYHRNIGRAIGLVPQQPYAALDPRQHLGDAVAEPMLVHGLVKSKAEARACVEQLFSEVLLGKELMNRLPSQVSGGQAQRVVIARALGIRPRLLIADEATSMLDPAAQSAVIGVLKSLVASRGIAVLIISHDPILIESTSDCVYTLSDGKINKE
jgi:ABC-type glutathione transport system ATPase component